MKHFLKNIKLHYNIKDYRFSLVILVTTLSIIGVFMVRSARPDLVGRQIMGVALGLAAMVVISLIDYKWVLSLYWPLYGLNILMLIAVPIFGIEANGAKRWLDLGFTQFQPSDLTKILMILFFARFLMDRKEKINNPKTLLQAIALIIPSLFMIYEQPNLSTTICIAALFCSLIFLGGLSYKYILPVIAVIVPSVIILLVVAVQPNQPFLEDYQQKRILAWLDPEKYADDSAYQQLNSVMAIGSGQLSGKGYNNDETTSVKNSNFVSEPQTDFIFAIINCDRLYFDRLKGKRYRWSDYLWRGGFADWHTEFYKRRRGYYAPSQHRFISSVCKLWTDFPCVLFYGNRFRAECRLAAE